MMERDPSADDAATRIQAAFRGGKARRHVDVVRARKDLRSALAAARSVPGSLQPEVVYSMLGLADAYMRAGDAAMAEQCYSVAMDSIERDYG